MTTATLPATAVFTPGRLPAIYARQHNILRVIAAYAEQHGHGMHMQRAADRWARRDLADLVGAGFLLLDADTGLLEVAPL